MGNFRLPTAVPSAIEPPWCHGPSARKTLLSVSLGLSALVDGDRAVDVFGVPLAGDEQRGNGDGLLGEDLVHRLLLPEGVIGRMQR